MIDELNTVLENYEKKWQKLISVRYERQLFSSLQPTAAAWKATDSKDFDKRFAELKDVSDQIHLGWINDRWLATFHLHDITLSNGISLVKLMERRPGSMDQIGLDHVDFLIDESMHIKSILTSETDLQWSEEMNGDNCQWISIWFDGTEAKLRSDTVLHVCADEMNDLEKKLLA